jgi:DNA-binding CsgD family transcriptional regulator
MPSNHAAAGVTQEIVRLCHEGLDSLSLRQQAIARLRRLVPIDSFWFATADPATLLFTGSLVEGIPEQATPLFVANEFLHEDVNKWSRLAASPIPVNSLSFATEGRPSQSARYRDICEPLGLGDELRAVLRFGNCSWGFMCLHRDRRGPTFRKPELELVAHLSPHLAHGLKSAVLLEQAEQAHVDAPGLLIVGSDLSLITVTPAGERWIAEIADHPARRELPQLICALIARLSAIESGSTTTAHLAPRARVQTRSGQWLVVHASRLCGRGQKEAAIILEPAPPAEVAPLLLQAYGLTRREGEVAQLVIRGFGTTAIAIALAISDGTVQQHLKAVFDKVGVGSRRELVAQMFARHYQSRIGKAP